MEASRLGISEGYACPIDVTQGSASEKLAFEKEKTKMIITNRLPHWSIFLTEITSTVQHMYSTNNIHQCYNIETNATISSEFMDYN